MAAVVIQRLEAEGFHVLDREPWLARKRASGEERFGLAATVSATATAAEWDHIIRAFRMGLTAHGLKHFVVSEQPDAEPDKQGDIIVHLEA